MSLLIGLVDQAISNSDKISWNDSKIGGSPLWMSNSKSPAIRKCRGCSMDMTLVVQLYCPLSNSAYHRCLYIFVCTSAGCPQCSSWKVFRGMQYDEAYAPTKSKKESNANLFDNDMWTDDQDDWGDDDDEEDNDWGNTVPNDEWGTGNNGLGNTTSKDASQSPKQREPSVPSQILFSAKEDQTVKTHDDFQVCNPVAISDLKAMSGDSPSHSATDEDISTCFSTMDVQESQDKAGAEGDTLMEDLNMPDTSRLDQLASVLNTKYKDSTEIDQASSRRQPVQLKPYYLSVVEGTSYQSHHDKDDTHIASLIREYEEVEGKQIKEIVSQRAQTKGKGGSEVYEKSSVKHGDKVFHKFWKEIRKFPEQCIRYERGGQPLLVQNLSPVQSVIPPCPLCGSPRVFELQLVPALIPWLCSQEGKPSSIEFGAILVYTCDKSCSPSSANDLDLFEEHAICQHDPDHHLYR